MAIRFEKLVSRDLARRLSRLLDLAGMKMPVGKLIEYGVFGFFAILIILPIALSILKYVFILAIILGIVGGVMYLVAIYMVINYKIDDRKTKMEGMLSDYFQIASANLRSGIAMDRSLLLAARPEFKFFADDIKEMNRQIFSGQTMESGLKYLAGRYKSFTLDHAIRMMIEAQRYGGAMADLLDQLSKDIRNQQLMQKEVAGQLFMYSIFIAFAGLVAAPVLYGLTSQMITITDAVWKGILASNPGGLPTTGLSFLKPSPPKISPGTYKTFALLAISVITGFAALIMSAISSGSPIRGIRLLPAFIVIGILIYLAVSAVIAGLFSTLGASGYTLALGAKYISLFI